MNKKFPFFIAGCVRSGTTMLRKVLTQHPRLECPEETHFFRWADPFGSDRYTMVYNRNKLITMQQEMDGFDKEEFLKIYESSTNRRELMDRYMEMYLQKQGNPAGRWFDKTPQHVYGLFLIKKSYPDARVIHIHRNPLNVVASLLRGAVMPKQTLVGAVNYWNESATLIEAFRELYPGDIMDLPYEAFCRNPADHLRRILAFIEEDDTEFGFDLASVHPEKNAYRKVLGGDQRRFVREACAEFMEKLGYSEAGD